MAINLPCGERVWRHTQRIIGASRPSNASYPKTGPFGESIRDRGEIWDGAVVAAVTVALKAAEPVKAREAGDTEQVVSEGAPAQANEIVALKPPADAMLRL